MFNSLYDEIFLQNDNDMFSNDRINDISKKYLEGNSSLNEKKFFLSLKKEYLKIKKINNRDLLQNKLYSGKNKGEIISFEIRRILNNRELSPEIISQINDIKKILIMYNNNLNDNLYYKVINSVIKIEISLGMKIGLFNELCNFFENEIDNIEKQMGLENTNYIRRK